MSPESFYARVRRLGECAEWTGFRTPRGYGKVYSHYAQGRGHHLFAHRAAWEIEVGPIPEGLQVLHRCDNPPCVRIEHLFLGTRSDNMRDASAKGRCAANWPKGPRHHSARVTPEIAASMRRGHAAGFTHEVLARHFGVGTSTVSRVVRDQHWTAAG